MSQSEELVVPKFIISDDYKFIYHTQKPRLLFSLFYDTADMRGGGQLQNYH